MCRGTPCGYPQIYADTSLSILVQDVSYLGRLGDGVPGRLGDFLPFLGGLVLFFVPVIEMVEA